MDGAPSASQQWNLQLACKASMCFNNNSKLQHRFLFESFWYASLRWFSMGTCGICALDEGLHLYFPSSAVGNLVILLGCLQRKRGRWLGDGALFLDFTHTPRQQSVDGCWLQTISTRTQWSSQGESFLAYRLTLWGSKRSVKKVFWCVLWSGVPNGHVNLCLDLPADVAEIEMMHDARL